MKKLAWKIALLVLAVMPQPQLAQGDGDNEGQLLEGETLHLDQNNSLAFQYLPAEGIRIHFTREGKPGTADVRVGETNRGGVAISRIQYMDKDRVWIFSANFRMGEEAVLLKLTDSRVERHLHGQEITLSPDKTQVTYREVGKRFWGQGAVYVDALMLYPKFEVFNQDGLGDALANQERITRAVESSIEEGSDSFIVLAPRWRDNATVEFIAGIRRYTTATVNERPWTRITHYVVSKIEPQGGHYQLEVHKEDLDIARLSPELKKHQRYKGDPDKALLDRLSDFVTSTTTFSVDVSFQPFHPRVDAPAAADQQEIQTTATRLVVKSLEVSVRGEDATLVDCIGGAFGGFDLVGGRACLATGFRLSILDMSSPFSPRLLGKILLPTTINHLAVAGSLACVATGDRYDEKVPPLLALIDISDPAHPAIRGACRLPYLPESLIAGGGRFWATGKFGLAELDPAHPETPVLRFAPFGLWQTQGIAIAGSRAYVTDNFYGLRIVDISMPGMPELRGACKLPGDSCEHLAVVGDKVYVSRIRMGVVTAESRKINGAIQIVDVANPDAPVLRQPITVGLLPNRLLLAGSTLVTNYQNGLCLINLANPAHPTSCTLSMGKGWPYSGRLLGVERNLVWTLNSAGLQIIDLSNPPTPQPRDVYPLLGPVKKVATQGQRLYIGGKTSLKILDLTQPEAPVLRGACQGASFTAMAIAGDRLYAAPYSNGVMAFDIANPDAPKMLSHWQSSTHKSAYTQSLAARGPLAFAIYTSTLAELIDFTQAAAPRGRGSIEKSSNLGGGGLIDSLACLASSNKLSIFDISNPDQFKQRAVMEIPEARVVVVSGKLAYLISGRTELSIVDLNNPDHPARRGSIALEDPKDYFSKLAVGGGLAGITNDRNGLVRFIDITNPDRPAFQGKITLPSAGIKDLALGGSYAYLALGGGGLAIVHHEPNKNILH